MNDNKPDWVLEKVKVAITDVLASKPIKIISDVKVACLGLSFKPDIDDLRESPAVQIVENLARLGCQVYAVEPNIKCIPKNTQKPNIKLTSVATALKEAEIVCILVKHNAFVENILSINQNKIVIDCVGFLHRA